MAQLPLSDPFSSMRGGGGFSPDPFSAVQMATNPLQAIMGAVPSGALLPALLQLIQGEDSGGGGIGGGLGQLGGSMMGLGMLKNMGMMGGPGQMFGAGGPLSVGKIGDRGFMGGDLLSNPATAGAGPGGGIMSSIGLK